MQLLRVVMTLDEDTIRRVPVNLIKTSIGNTCRQIWIELVNVEEIHPETLDGDRQHRVDGMRTIRVTYMVSDRCIGWYERAQKRRPVHERISLEDEIGRYTSGVVAGIAAAKSR